MVQNAEVYLIDVALDAAVQDESHQQLLHIILGDVELL